VQNSIGRGMAARSKAQDRSFFRLPKGGLIDRSRPVDFELDGRMMSGFAGDTLASALLATVRAWLGAASNIIAHAGY